MKFNLPQSNKGYTLFELLIIGVIALAIGVAGLTLFTCFHFISKLW